MSPAGADPLADNPVFARADPELRARLVAASERLLCTPGQRILSEGDAADRVFALARGAVRVFHVAPGGAQLLLKVFRAPALFGEAEAFCQIRFLEHVEALEPCELWVLPTAALLALLRDDPASALALSLDLAARLTLAIQNAKSVAFGAATTRLANYLVEYVAWTNEPGAHEPRIALTQNEMAAAVGITTRAVGLDVALWRREGILSRRGRSYVVHDLAGLRRYADPQHLGLTYSLGDRVRRIAERLESTPARPTRRRDR